MDRPTAQPTPASRPGLTDSQRRDLRRMAAAGVLTVAGLAGVLWLVSCPPRHQGTARGIGGDAALTATAPVPAPQVTIMTREVVVPVSAPAIAGSGRPPVPAPVRAGSAPPRAHAPRTADRRASDGLPRRVARFITGDGRHEVRPFPTVPQRP